MVLTARDSDPIQAEKALEELCRTYWYPLYSYLRRQGHQPADAEDLVQGLIARLLQRDFLKKVMPEKGRFRTFLLTCLRHYLADQNERARAQKRGGGQQAFSLERLPAEERYLQEGSSQESPAHFFERQWALSVIETSLERLRVEAECNGRGELFAVLRNSLAGERASPPCSEVAQRHGLHETSVRSSIRRLRDRYRELFREEIARTVDNPGEVEEEIRHLLSVLSE